MTIKLLTDWPYKRADNAGYITMPAGSVVGVFDAGTEAAMIVSKVAEASALAATWVPPSEAPIYTGLTAEAAAAVQAAMSSSQFRRTWLTLSAGDLGRVRVPVAFLGNSFVDADGLCEVTATNCPSLDVAVRAGVGGNTTAQLLARVDADVPDFVRACFILEHVNDAVALVTQAQHIANMRALCVGLIERGILPALVLGGPRNTAVIVHENAAMRLRQTFLAYQLGIPVYDPFNAYINAPDGYWTSGSSGDGTHPTAATYEAAALQLSTLVQAGSMASIRPTYNNQSGSLLNNCLMLSDSNTDGVANNWTQLYGTAGYSNTLTSAASDGVRGNWQNIVVDAISGTRQIYSSGLSSGWSVGEEIVVCAAVKLEVTSGAVAAAFYVTTDGGTTKFWLCKTISINSGPRFVTARFKMPAGSTSIQLHAYISGGSAYTATMRFGEVGVYNASRLVV